MKDPYEVMRETFGHRAFKARQREVIETLLAGHDVLAVLPTGAGKSLCYQVPALCRGGLAVVVSPLIALMEEQVARLQERGVAAACVHGEQTSWERGWAYCRAADGKLSFLYATPERAVREDFSVFLSCTHVGMVAVDEAQCVTRWGRGFRPDYLRIADFVRGLKERPVVCAFTATATPSMRADIVRMLELEDPRVIVADMGRPNLRLYVERPRDKDAALLAFCRAHVGECGIVYCMSRRHVEHVWALLAEEGLAAAPYHAGLRAAARRSCFAGFESGDVRIVIATSAFGMGIDKGDVRFVVHYDLPLDLEDYCQQVGRAGRDGRAAGCILFYDARDACACRYLIDRGYERRVAADGSPESVREAQRARMQANLRLEQMVAYANAPGSPESFIERYFYGSASIAERAA